VEGRRHGLIQVLSWYSPRGTKDTNENFRQDSKSLGQDWNPVPPEYKPGVPTIWLQRLVTTPDHHGCTQTLLVELLV
jgi:hypothetical protein